MIEEAQNIFQQLRDLSLLIPNSIPSYSKDKKSFVHSGDHRKGWLVHCLTEYYSTWSYSPNELTMHLQTLKNKVTLLHLECDNTIILLDLAKHIDGAVKGLCHLHPSVASHEEVQDVIVEFEKIKETISLTPHLPISEEEWETKMKLSTLPPTHEPTHFQYWAGYRLGLFYNYIHYQWNKRDTIFQEDDFYISLSQVPQVTDKETILEEGILAILAVVEPFENYDANAVDPISWRDSDIDILQISARDFGGVDLNNILLGAAFIKRCKEQKKPVLIHCKAGRGRSFLIALAYLIIHQHMSAEEAYAHIQQFRPQAKLHGIKKEQLEEINRLFNE